MRVEGGGPRSFADALVAARPGERCDYLYSLERVWECDAYRAGDGVHAAWLQRRREYEPAWKGWFRAAQPKHREILELERAVFAKDSRRVIIANSNLVAREIIAGFDVEKERVRVVHNGLPIDPAAPGKRKETRERLEVGEGQCLVLFAGSGWERKGLRYAMAGVERVQNATLLVAGEGRRRRLPKKRQTRFLGAVTEMRELMEAADLFLLPTLYDPFSNASLEAMAAGLPVITTRGNGFAEIMRAARDGEVLSRPEDTKGIAEAIEKWRSLETEAARGERRIYASGFSIEKNVRQTLQALGLTGR